MTRMRAGAAVYPFATNALGMVDDKPRRIEPSVAACRYLMIGDAAIEGYGVGWRQSVAGILARRWRVNGVDVLNAGVAGYSPTIHYRRIRHLVEDVGLRFGAVLVFVDASDIGEEWWTYDLDADGNVVAIGPARQMRPMRDPNWRDHLRFWAQDNSVAGKLVKIVHDQLVEVIPRRQWTRATHLFQAHGRRTCQARRPACPVCPVRGLCPWPGKTSPGGGSRRRGDGVIDVWYKVGDYHRHDVDWPIIRLGDRWGEAGRYAWFRRQVRIPEAWAGQPVCLHLSLHVYVPHTVEDALLTSESLVYIDGVPVQAVDRHHREVLLTEKARGGETFQVAIEAFAGMKRDAAIIGRIVEEHPGMVVMRSLVGGERVVSMLAGEQLPRIC